MKRLSVLCLTAILAISFLPCIPVQAKDKNPQQEALKDMKKVASNNQLTLYIDEEETDIAVMDNASGKVWFSNPVDVDTDDQASNYYKRVMKSQLQLQYYNESVQSSVMDNYNDSIMNGQFSIDYIDNGVTIQYYIGAAVANLLLPDVIAQERMESFQQNMDDKSLKKLNRNYTLVIWDECKTSEQKTYAETYPGFEGMNFYILRGGVKDYLKEELAGYFEAAGYTMDDLQADKIASGLAEAENDKPWFQIPLTYTLDQDNLVVTVNPADVEYNTEGYYLVDIEVLPYFGAARDTDGYIFVPDGSGALINLDNGKNNYSAYTAAVYGTDKSKLILAQTKSEIEDRLSIKLPVFGLKSGDQAFFTIIEHGDGYANISADVAGRTGSYNHVNAGFSYLQYGIAALSDMVGGNTYQLYAAPSFADTYQLRYAFFTDNSANYSGMANYYQHYLESKGILQRITEKKEVPFFTEYIGAIDKYKTVLGVKYKAVEPLTGYAQAKEISMALKNAGVVNQNVVYTGWMNKGLHGTANTKLSKISSLEKNGVSLKKYLQDMQTEQIATYMTVDMQYVYQDNLLDGYSKLQYAPSYFDHTNITVNKFAIADGDKEGKLADLISPYYAKDVTKKIQKEFAKYEGVGINLGTVSWELYSDFLEEKYTDRQQSIFIYQDSFKTLGENVGSLIGDNSNAYAWNNTAKLINVPLSSNRYQILDEDIPFYEMVIHGFQEYAGEALNMSDDYMTTLLKSVESGAGLHFQWIYEDNSLLKETEFENLYSVHYANWFEKAVADYTRVNEVLKELTACQIVEHIRIQADVSRITYSDNSVVYVNFGNDTITVDGICINARDFVVKKGSE